MKTDLKNISGINITYDIDCITFDCNPEEAQVKMPCGHAFSSETIAIVIQSLISEK